MLTNISKKPLQKTSRNWIRKYAVHSYNFTLKHTEQKCHKGINYIRISLGSLLRSHRAQIHTIQYDWWREVHTFSHESGGSQRKHFCTAAETTCNSQYTRTGTTWLELASSNLYCSRWSEANRKQAIKIVPSIRRPGMDSDQNYVSKLDIPGHSRWNNWEPPSLAVCRTGNATHCAPAPRVLHFNYTPLKSIGSNWVTPIL